MRTSVGQRGAALILNSAAPGARGAQELQWEGRACCTGSCTSLHHLGNTGTKDAQHKDPAAESTAELQRLLLSTCLNRGGRCKHSVVVWAFQTSAHSPRVCQYSVIRSWLLRAIKKTRMQAGTDAFICSWRYRMGELSESRGGLTALHRLQQLRNKNSISKPSSGQYQIHF